LPSGVRPADDAGGRPREYCGDRSGADDARARDRPTRLHHLEWSRDVGRSQLIGKVLQVALDHRADIGIERRHHQPFVLAELAVDLR
jgi:hypothetical protein